MSKRIQIVPLKSPIYKYLSTISTLLTELYLFRLLTYVNKTLIFGFSYFKQIWTTMYINLLKVLNPSL